MELNNFLVFLFTAISIAFVAVLRKKNQGDLNLPPGPWKLPFIGNLHQLLGPLPHHRLRDLAKKHGPLMHLKLGEVSMVVASSAEAAEEILNTHDLNFASRPIYHTVDVLTYGGKGLAIASYGEQWKQRRKICTTELFSAKRVLSFRYIREEEIRNLVHSISSTSSAGKLVNLTETLESTMNNIIASAVIGSYKDQAAFLEGMHEA